MSAGGRERRLREILDSVLDLPPQERRSALETATGDDALREEAADLIEREDELGGFLAAPAAAVFAGEAPEWDASADDAAPEPPLPEIPGYTVERTPRLRRDGLGLPGSPDRAGAAHGGDQDDPRDRRGPGARPPLRRSSSTPWRASTTRPSPSSTTRGTTPEGRPYVMMEYVEGVPITTWCDRNRLPVDERMRLFVAVCRGVEHAHRRQLLHRDLKPTNLLVTGVDGAPGSEDHRLRHRPRSARADAGRTTRGLAGCGAGPIRHPPVHEPGGAGAERRTAGPRHPRGRLLPRRGALRAAHRHAAVHRPGRGFDHVAPADRRDRPAPAEHPRLAPQPTDDRRSLRRPGATRAAGSPAASTATWTGSPSRPWRGTGTSATAPRPPWRTTSSGRSTTSR